MHQRAAQLLLIEVNDVHLDLLPNELAGVHEGAVRRAPSDMLRGSIRHSFCGD